MKNRPLLLAVALALLATPPPAEAQVSDTLLIEGFAPIANVVRRGCPDDPLRAAIGTTVSCTYVALDANGDPVPASFSFRVGGNAGPFNVSLEEFGDSAIATIEVTGTGSAEIIVDVTQPPEGLSFLLVVPRPETLAPGEVPAYYYQSEPNGPIPLSEPLSEPALWCVFYMVGSRRVSKNDALCPGEIPLMSEVSETGLSIEFACTTDGNLTCADAPGYDFVRDFDFGEGTRVTDVSASRLDAGLREARLSIEALPRPRG